MASLIYDSFLDDVFRANIDVDSDTFYVMLVGSGYTPNKGTHLKRSDVTSEVTGTGYTAGGQACALAVTKDATNHRVDVGVTVTGWPTSTISAVAAVVYKHRGGSASADELVCWLDFGGTITSTAGTFSVTVSSPLRIQN